MLVKACDAIDIFELNKRKEYTLTATCILESVLTNPKLNAQTVKLWQFLFNKARFHSNLEVQICYNELAKDLHRSNRSISRYVKTLVQEGYLLIDENFSTDGSQRPNTLYVRVPSIVVEEVKNKKDRVVNKDCFSSKKYDMSSSSRSLNKISNNSSSDTLLTSEDQSQTTISKLNGDTIMAEVQPANNLEESLGISISKISLEDKNDVGEDDKSVIHKDIIKKDIIINNNTVVSTLHESFKNDQQTTNSCEQGVLRGTDNSSQDNQDQQEIDRINSEINLLYVKLGSTSGSEKMAVFDKIRKLQSITSSITVVMTQRKQAMQSTIEAIKSSESISTRELTSVEIDRIEKAIEKYSVPVNDTKKVLNEVVYSIRFGALRADQNGNKLSIGHAISIALKLVREGRWTTPVTMQKKEFSAYKNYFQKQSFRGQQGIGNLLQNIGYSCT